MIHNPKRLARLTWATALILLPLASSWIQATAEVPAANKSGTGGGKVLTAWVRNLHYPKETDLEKVRREAEADLHSMHYRRAIQKIHPDGILPDRVDRVKVTARRGADVKGLSSGVVIDAQVWFFLR